MHRHLDYIVRRKNGKYRTYYKLPGKRLLHVIKCPGWKSLHTFEKKLGDRAAAKDEYRLQKIHMRKRIERGVSVPFATGSAQEVYLGLAMKTTGGLTQSDLAVNKRGVIVSRRRSERAKARFHEVRDKFKDQQHS